MSCIYSNKSVPLVKMLKDLLLSLSSLRKLLKRFKSVRLSCTYIFYKAHESHNSELKALQLPSLDKITVRKFLENLI